MSALDQALRLARLRESQAREALRLARQRADRAAQVVVQLERFAGEYRNAAVRAGERGAAAGGVADARRFESTLERTARENAASRDALRERADEAAHLALAAERRTRGLQRMADARARERARELAAREAREIEDGLLARSRGRASASPGTNAASVRAAPGSDDRHE